MGLGPLLGEGRKHWLQADQCSLGNHRGKPAYRDAFREHRCLVPADGFYEWKRKQPFNFGMHDNSLFGFAGIWDRWKNAEGTVLETCSILTTSPSAVIADVHDRMPVILRPDDYDLWLDSGFKRVDALVELFKPFDPSLMRRYPVSGRVNAVKNDDPGCAAEVPVQQPMFEG